MVPCLPFKRISTTCTIPVWRDDRKFNIPSSLWYKTHFSRQSNCWSFRCSWSIACRHCSNYIFILNLTPDFNGLGKDSYKMRREAFKSWDLVRLILETLRYFVSYNKFSMTQVHYSDVIMSMMASQITGISIVAQPFVQAQIKENIKALNHWPLWGEFPSDRWIPHTKGQ